MSETSLGSQKLGGKECPLWLRAPSDLCTVTITRTAFLSHFAVDPAKLRQVTYQVRIQRVRLGGVAISVIFGSQAS